MVVGTTRPDIEHDRSHVSEVAGKIRDLNQKLEDIRREQQYQREREAAFRDLSEATNGRAVWYIVAEIVILLVTCAWQLRHLRVRYSISTASHTLTLMDARISSRTANLVDEFATDEDDAIYFAHLRLIHDQHCSVID